MEGWTDLVYDLSSAQSEMITRVFFNLIIIFGSMLLLNLALAVICDNYESVTQVSKPQPQPILPRHTTSHPTPILTQI